MRNMTTNEAIKWFENRKSGSTMPGARMVFDMALEALREKAARENPEPLTLEELRQMIGEPVWCVPLDDKPQRAPMWQIAGDRMYWGSYGKTWIAYREKPKEE